MSTAGKVLAAVVMVMSAVCVLLAAPVAELNRNSAKAVEGQQAAYAKLEGAIAAAQASIQQLKNETFMVQFATQNDLTTLEIRQSDAEKARSQVIEMLTRVKLQLDGTGATDESASANKEQRLADRISEREATDKLIAEVDVLKSQNAELLERLTSLRDAFKTTLQSNKEMVERLQKVGAVQPGRAAVLLPTRR